ncbi:Hint domain-containing protein [uncultured Roseobacter sp.]|uniref:Hint domain-containing protein n=1 Tax=uncultured Roseobacter sp. TaxID=114847 RepID=UPI0026342546|nr:Hint domain-containing protein [uncultured Roseobacter sp.]
MKTGCHGTFVIKWSQTEIDGLDAPSLLSLTVGAAWSWRGDAVQIDGPAGLLRIDRDGCTDALRRRATARVYRLVHNALEGGSLHMAHPIASAASLPSQSFAVTDGARSYAATMIGGGDEAGPLLMFVDELPPRGTDLWVERQTLHDPMIREPQDDSSAVICFTPGTRIATPSGPRLIEHLKMGDLVLTKDDGPQPVQWIGRRHMNGTRLLTMAGCRPVRIRAGALGVDRPDQELLVSPQHRMLITGSAARALFNTPEVLVTAKDLVDGRKIVVDRSVKEVVYIHLLLPRHSVIWANGVLTESFHPASAALSMLDPSDRDRLLQQHPRLARDPRAYGSYARRSLTRPEAVQLRYAA